MVGASRWLLLLALAWGFVVPIGPVKASPPPVSSSVSISATVPNISGNIRMTGYASPNALVTFLHEGVVAGTSTADSNSFFDKTLTGYEPGLTNFSLYGSDALGRNTLTLTFDITIISGSTITLSGFLLPPTMSVQKENLKRPDAQKVDGYTRQDATITTFFTGDEGIAAQTRSAANGSWNSTITNIFHLGFHSAQSLTQDDFGGTSNLSQSKLFTVLLSADLNVDDKVNLTDFSILMFNYARGDFPNPAADINDNRAPPDLVDFSIMMFHWTGN